MELRQKAGLSIDLDSLMRMSNLDMYGQRHWGFSAMDPYRWNLTEGDLLSTLIAYRILRRSGKTEADLNPILAWILNQRNAYGWGNTYKTAQVLATIVPDIGVEGFSGAPRVHLIVNGEQQLLKLDSTLTFPATTELKVQKDGFGITYFSAYQTWFNKQPESIDSLFAIKTVFKDKKTGQIVESLVAGSPVTMEVEVNVKQDGEYLMLEVPIPSSCSYASKHVGYYDGYTRSYREYFRQKTAFYFRRLGVGKYHFQIELLPRYTGHFTVNAARMESMYFPVLAGQNVIGSVKVK